VFSFRINHLIELEDLLCCTGGKDVTVMDGYNILCQWCNESNIMGLRRKASGYLTRSRIRTHHKKNRPPLHQIPTEAMLNNPSTGMDVKSSQHIIKQDDFRLGVNRTSETNSRLLATTQCQTLLPYLSLIPGIEKLQIWFESALVKNLLVPLFIEVGMEDDVVLQSTSDVSRRKGLNTNLDSIIQNPCLLRSIGNTVLSRDVIPGIRCLRDEMHFTFKVHE
jgi:hypothetical protein